MEIEHPDLENIIQYFYIHLLIVLYTNICCLFVFPNFFCSSTLLASLTSFWEPFSRNTSFRMSFRTYVDGNVLIFIYLKLSLFLFWSWMIVKLYINSWSVVIFSQCLNHSLMPFMLSLIFM